MSDTAAAIFRHYESTAEDGRRPHMGASLAGHECERFLWNSFRWAYAERHEGRVLRLFETGQMQEARIVANLRAIGCEVSEGPAPGEQWRFAAIGGHVGGSMDAAVRGLPESPDDWHVAEFKTSNDRAFRDLVKRGVRDAKPLHHAQMTLYMGWSEMPQAVYVCVNKNTDDLHIERVPFDQAAFDGLMRKLERIVRAAEPPPRISDDADAKDCAYCPFHKLCHGGAIPQANCRTCAHATPEFDGEARWSCAWHKRDLTDGAQRAGCRDHRYIPPHVTPVMVPVSYRDDGRIAWAVKGAGEVLQPPWQSSEIALAVNAGTPEVLADRFTNALKEPDPETGESMGAVLERVDTPFTDMKDDLPWLEQPKPTGRKSRKAA